MSKLDIAWRRLLIEGTAIVLSILLAFAIDAWWQDREQQQADYAQLDALLEELRVHKTLLAESKTSHKSTLSEGVLLLESIKAGPEARPNAVIADQLSKYFNFYEINAPFGALQSAVASGALSRMRNSALASSLASWPSKIEDLIEEQDSGERLVFDLMAMLSQLMPLSDVFRSRLGAPVARGTDEVVDFAVFTVPASRHEADYAALFEDPEVENAILLLMVITSGALAEAEIFDAELDKLMDRLETCLRDASC